MAKAANACEVECGSMASPRAWYAAAEEEPGGAEAAAAARRRSSSRVDVMASNFSTVGAREPP